MHKEIKRLTQQEIDNAPEWATHYFINKFNSKVRYTDGVHFNTGRGQPKITVPEDLDDPLANTKPIPRKEFDISEYEFSSCEFDIILDNGAVLLMSPDYENFIDINKKDAIALAKHFKLTAEDLK